VVPFVNVQPTHPWLTHTIGNLECGDAGEIGSEAANKKLRLHPSNLGHLIIFIFHVRLQLRNGVPDVTRIVIAR